jgi:hypothetical protein
VSIFDGNIVAQLQIAIRMAKKTTRPIGRQYHPSASREEWGSARSARWGSTHDEAAERVCARAGARKQQ